MSGEFFRNKWLFFESYVKVVIDGRMLIYNTLTGEMLENDHPEIIRYFTEVTSNFSEPLFSLSNEAFIDEQLLLPFIEALFSLHMIEVIPKSDQGERPFVFIPEIKINKDFLRGKEVLFTGEDCYEYLHQLNINLVRKLPANNESQRLGRCQHIFFDSFGDSSVALPPTLLRNVVPELKNTNLREISVVLNPIDGHPDLGEIMDVLGGIDAAKRFILDCDDAFRNGEIVRDLGKEMPSSFTVIIPMWQKSRHSGNKIEHLAKSLGERLEVLLFIEGEGDLPRADDILSQVEGLRVNCLPIFNGKNLQFFEDNVFLRKENIFSKVHSFNDIFCNETLNRSAFGRLYIDADGECCGELGRGTLGNIINHNLGQIIYKELCEGESWKRTRKTVSPCSRCIYNLFCPPISNYELVMNRMNLCHMHDEWNQC